MPTWRRGNPVIVQSLLKEVISSNAQLLYDRAFEKLYGIYEQAAKDRGYSQPSMQGFKQVLLRKLQAWEKTLKEGGTLS